LAQDGFGQGRGAGAEVEDAWHEAIVAKCCRCQGRSQAAPGVSAGVTGCATICRSKARSRL
jgi:hypothetical protein